MKRRIVCLLFAILSMRVGLASRRFRPHLQSFIGEYSGDVVGVVRFVSASDTGRLNSSVIECLEELELKSYWAAL